MYRRTILLFALIVLAPLYLVAQKNSQVNLKNGSIIRGNVVEIIPEGNVTIHDLAGNTWVYPMSDVASIEKISNTAMAGTDLYPSGWAGMVTAGFLAGSQNSQQSTLFSLLGSFGYRHSYGLYSGVATGLEFLNINHVPLMADLQYALNSGPVAPVLILRGGYAFPTKGTDYYYGSNYNYTGGIAGSAGVGLKIRNREQIAWDISILYRYMRINYSSIYDYQSILYEYTDVYNRLELRVGFYLD